MFVAGWTFKIGPVNGRETQESGRRVKSDAPIAVIQFEPRHLPPS
jgi:hypothetical protein